MNTQSLNRSIGLAMSALQQARAYGYSAHCIYLIKSSIRLLNKARNYLKRGLVSTARFAASLAFDQIKVAIIAR